jgi:hypothetical protein
MTGGVGSTATDRADHAGKALRFAGLICAGVPMIVLCAIWIPPLAHYYVQGAPVSDEIVARSRSSAADPMLLEIERMRLSAPLGFRTNEDLIAAAAEIRAGRLTLPGRPPSAITVPFGPADFGSTPLALPFASLVVTEILLNAHELTGDERLFAAAKQHLVGFAEHERAAWLPDGLLWNDHAIAARIPVLTKFWRLYRVRPDFDAATGRIVLGLLARSGALLAKPGHYTYRTNHGVMQNLGLFYLCLAFPAIPGASEWCDVAYARLSAQLPFYVNREGVVLEHSAGYQRFGMELLAMVLRCLTLAERPLPPEWAAKYTGAQEVYAQLRRPDGTLPIYGDTPSAAYDPPVIEIEGPGRASPLRLAHGWRPRVPFMVTPAAGYAIWWRDLAHWPRSFDLAQTVVTWANYPSRAHKHGDDLSVLLWRGGQTWVTNSGYWPYTMWGRQEVEGWNGANAPHLTGEKRDSPRTTALLGYGDNGSVTVVDVTRNGPDQYLARRQVVQVGSDLWLVLDHVRDAAQGSTTTTWTVDPALEVVPGAQPNAFRLIGGASGTAMSAIFASGSALRIERYRGSRAPFAGWVVMAGRPTPAHAFSITYPTGESWALAAWAAEKQGENGAFTAAPEMLEWAGSDRWKLMVPLRSGTITVQRNQAELSVRDEGAGAINGLIPITSAPGEFAARAEVLAAFEAARNRYPPYREVRAYRVKVTWWLLALLAAQELTLFALRQRLRSRVHAVRLALALGWLIAGAWLVFVYFAA